jgi:hypothetical protein
MNPAFFCLKDSAAASFRFFDCAFAENSYDVLGLPERNWQGAPSGPQVVCYFLNQREKVRREREAREAHYR